MQRGVLTRGASRLLTATSKPKGVIAALVVFALASGGAPAPSLGSSGTIGFSVSGGLDHAVGDEITITPTGDYAFTGSFQCLYTLEIQQPLAPDSPDAYPSIIETTSDSVGGACPAWTFRLPNPAQMVYYPPGSSTSVTVWISVMGGPDELNMISLTQTVTFATSSDTVAPSSSLPAVFWTLSKTASSPGESVTIAVDTEQFPWKCSASYASSWEGVSNPDPYTDADTCADITFTQRAPGTYFVIHSEPDGVTGLGALSYILAQDPPAGPMPDTARPSILGTNPKRGARAVSRASTIAIHFSEPVTGVSGKSLYLLNLRTGSRVRTVVRYTGTSRTATINPVLMLMRSTRYRVVAAGTIHDRAGNRLPAASYTFLTSSR
jgi:hypothetical protein